MINEASNQYMEPLCMQQILPPLTGLASITQRGQGHTKQSKANIDGDTKKSEENSLLLTFLMEHHSGDSEPPSIRVFGSVRPVESVGSGRGEKSGWN